jgi:hypothetical protein
MAVNPISTYPTKTVSDSDYTYGKARDVPTPNSGTGTPFVANLINDLWGMQQALLDEAQIVPSNVADTASLSEYYQAFQAAIERHVERYINTSIGAKSLSDRIGQVRTSDEISAPYSDANLIPLTTYYWRNCAPGYNPVTRKETALFIIDDDDSKIIQIENRTKDFAMVQTELPITLAANHVPDSLCCDGSGVYILCHSAATGTAAIVYKFAWTGTPLLWSSTPVWSTALSAGIRSERDGSTVIKIADDSRVVAFCNGVSLTTGVEPLSVLLKSTGAETTGHGNAIVGDRVGGTGLCISGGNIWFITRTAGDETYYINGAQIVNPTLAPTSYATPVTVSGGEPRVGSIDSDGYMILMPANNGSVNTFNTADGTGTQFQLHQFNVDIAESDDFPVCVFDGARFWTFWQFSNGVNAFLRPIDMNKARPATLTYLDQSESTVTHFPWSTTQISDKARMCYSDGCLWLIADANTAYGGIKAQRIPRLALR